ncbi:nucleoside deaminase [Nocardioides panacisoli]|uniref:nucleoside deaminase n=1 Tax=Nocardioides panacisoli TaxID=627624 RepID=UPI001C62ED24|nr:nucleoside deaminase [Nocardioides panacisoli]QYJ04115.1 nucleoside deaminase [Nocardioides panacisoli]
MTSDARWLQQAVALATASVAEGGGPFGAVIVRGDEVVAEAANRVTLDLDPTAHAEVAAIRIAARTLGTHELTGCTLYASCEPCPMCASSALWARLDRVCYAADRHDAARGGFDDAVFYELFDRPRESWPMPVHQERLADAAQPFDTWLDHEDRTAY